MSNFMHISGNPKVDYAQMSLALLRSIHGADITDGQKENILLDAVKQSPKYRMGSITEEQLEFERLVIRESIDEYKRGEWS